MHHKDSPVRLTLRAGWSARWFRTCKTSAMVGSFQYFNLNVLGSARLCTLPFRNKSEFCTGISAAHHLDSLPKMFFLLSNPESKPKGRFRLHWAQVGCRAFASVLRTPKASSFANRGFCQASQHVNERSRRVALHGQISIFSGKTAAGQTRQGGHFMSALGHNTPLRFLISGYRTRESQFKMQRHSPSKI